MLCTDLAIEMPDSFPCQQFTRLREMTRDRFTPSQPPSWLESVSASNLIGWRYRTFVESAGHVISMLPTAHEDIFLRDQMLFLGVIGATSCIEATSYATYALASDPTVLGVVFGTKEKRGCSPLTLSRVLTTASVDPAISEPWKEPNRAEDWVFLNDLRNRMIHRANLPMIVTATTGPRPLDERGEEYAATSSTPAFNINSVAELEPWLARTVHNLLTSAIELLRQHNA